MQDFMLNIPGLLPCFVDLHGASDNFCICYDGVLFLRFEKVHSRYHVRGFFYESYLVYTRSFGSKREMMLSVQQTIDSILGGK